MQVSIDKKNIKISFPYDKEIVAKCKHFGMRWSKVTRLWSMPNNLMNRRCLNRLFPGLLPPEPKKEVKELVVPSFLMKHQANALRKAARENRRGIFHDTGTGKSCTALEIFRHHRVKTLVVCPLSLIEGAWFTEIGDRYPDIDAANLWKAKKRSPVAFNKALEKDMGIINYESFRTVDKKLATAGYKAVILDESSRIKTWKKGSTTDKMISFCDNMEYVYLLSGVPAPNSILEYWAQIRILDPLLWDKSFYRWKLKHFHRTGPGGFTWTINPDKEEKLMADIRTVAEYVDKEDVIDLPGKTESRRIFQLSAKEMTHYRDIKNNLMTILKNGEQITSPNALAARMKLRQVSSGFIMDTTTVEVDEKVKKKTEIFHIGNSKLKELMALIEDIGKKQVIIWIEFQEEANLIKEALAKKGYDSGILNGTVPESQKQITLEAFKSGNLPYIICHPKSVGFGHTLVNCTESIYYSCSYSYDNMKQSRDRIYRKGQYNKCSYYYLLAAKTLDTVILNAVSRKEDLSMAILNYLKSEK